MPVCSKQNATNANKFNYNAESVETSQETIELNKADFCECLESECGAYDTANKRCNYRGG